MIKDYDCRVGIVSWAVALQPLVMGSLSCCADGPSRNAATITFFINIANVDQHPASDMSVGC